MSLSKTANILVFPVILKDPPAHQRFEDPTSSKQLHFKIVRSLISRGGGSEENEGGKLLAEGHVLILSFPV